MLHSNYFESVTFDQGNHFNVARKIDVNYIRKLHWHPFIEIMVSLSDENAVTLNFTRYELKMNDILISYPGDLHIIDEGTESSYLIIQFPNELFTIMNELRNNDTLFYQFPYLSYDPLNAKHDEMLLYLKQFSSAYESDSPFREVHMFSLLLRFFEQLGLLCMTQNQKAAADDQSTDRKYIKRMTEACLYISANCKSPLTLDDVASHMGITKSYFANLFKKHTNMTFLDFLTSERIKQAQAMFLNPDALIIDIAFECGFSSVSSFNRAFKKVTGVSPSKFRETMLPSLS